MANNKIIKRADGRYQTQIYLGRNKDGKKEYKYFYAKKKSDLENIIDEVRASMRNGIDIKKGDQVFSELASKWLKTKNGNVSPQWYMSLNSFVKTFNSYFGNKKIKDITEADIEEVINDQFKINPNTKKPASKKHLKELRGTARAIFKYAIGKDKSINFNPAIEVDIPSKAQESIKRRALTDSEQQWILDTEHRAKRAAMIMMYSGLRRGELVVLTWSDINLDEGTISVNKSSEVVGGQFLIKDSAKSAAGIRVIDIPRRLVDYLKAETRDSILVCTDAHGRLHTDSSWRGMWDSYLKEINFRHGDFSPFQNRPQSKFDPKGIPFVIPRFTAHWLRHTYCTLLYHAGIDVLTAMKQMGHADVNTTLSIYTHLDSIYKRKAMSKLDTLLEEVCQRSVNPIVQFL